MRWGTSRQNGSRGSVWKSQPATTPIYTFNTGDTIINEKQAQS